MKWLIVFSLSILFTSCTTHNHHETRGERIVKGVIIGGGAGGIIGHQKGRGLEGSLIGGLLGGILGAISHDDRPHETEPVRERHVHHEHYHRTSTTYYIDKCGRRIYVDKYGNAVHKRYRHNYNPVTGECYYD